MEERHLGVSVYRVPRYLISFRRVMDMKFGLETDIGVAAIAFPTIGMA